MKTKIKVNELTDTTVTAVSLVKHGANRTPFKVVKSDDGKAIGLGDRLSDLFRGNKANAVNAFFVRKGAELPKFEGVLKAAGFLAAGKDDGDVRVYEQAEFSESRMNQFFQLTPDVGVAVTKSVDKVTIAKDFCSYGVEPSMDFDENLKASSFYPGLYNACDALRSTLSAAMDEASTPAEAGAAVKPVLDAFSAYVSSLVSDLPTMLFKVENGLSREFGSHNVAATQPNGDDMNVKPLKDAVAGDLDGLQKSDPAPVAAVVADPAATAAVVVPTVVVPAVEVTADAAAAVVAAEPAAGVEKGDAALLAMAASIKALADSVEKSSQAHQTAFEALTKRIDAVETVAKSASDKARSVTVTSTAAAVQLDQSLGLREQGGQRLQKSADVWGGLMEDLPGMQI